MKLGVHVGRGPGHIVLDDLEGNFNCCDLSISHTSGNIAHVIYDNFTYESESVRGL